MSQQPQPYLSFPEDDVVLLRLSAELGSGPAPEAQLEARAAQAPFFLVVDFKGWTGKFDAELREEGPKLIKAEWMLGVVYLNTSLPIRMGIKVFNLAMSLRGKGDFSTEYVSDESEVPAALDRLRQQRALR